MLPFPPTFCEADGSKGKLRFSPSTPAKRSGTLSAQSVGPVMGTPVPQLAAHAGVDPFCEKLPCVTGLKTAAKRLFSGVFVRPARFETLRLSVAGPTSNFCRGGSWPDRREGSIRPFCRPSANSTGRSNGFAAMIDPYEWEQRRTPTPLQTRIRQRFLRSKNDAGVAASSAM